MDSSWSDSAAGTVPDEPLRRLVDRAVERDADAWEELYRRNYRQLFGFARRRLYDDQAAEDAVSETMTRALANIDRFSWQGSGFEAWLNGIARNVVFELARGRHRTVPLAPDERATLERGPEDQVVANDAAAELRRAFDRLDPDERELLELRVQARLSSEDVGRLVGKQPGAVRMAQARALQRLRTILEEVQRAN